jgi:hypothetical protein
MTQRNVLIFALFSFLTIACKHQPSIIEEEFSPNSSTIEEKVMCIGCSIDSLCAIVDDITVSASTQFVLGPVSPSGQGTATLTNGCFKWVSAIQTDIIHTYILACNGTECDTTFFNILPPPPKEDMGIPCSPDSVYFERDILPVLTQNCAYSGCHNAITHADDVVLDSYANAKKEVKVGNASQSELYKVIISTAANKVMPPPPAAKLPAASIALIKKWIDQGAKDLKCDDKPICDTINVSYNNFVKPSLAACVTCHKTGRDFGGINLESYETVKASIAFGKLLGSIRWTDGFLPMPLEGTKLPDCTIRKISAWVEQGAKNN